MSITLYNLSILGNLSEQNILESYGFKINETIPALSVLSFEDDAILIGKSKDAVLSSIIIIMN